MLRGAIAGITLLLAAPTATAVLLAPSAEAAPLTVATVSIGTKVSAYSGRVAWSEPRGPEDRRRYVLVERVGGHDRLLPVPARASRPFDVDLGPDGHGGVAAVYSRCRDVVAHA